ncbi:MAG: CRISPR-associated protein Cas4 [Planctomycetota bacterium]
MTGEQVPAQTYLEDALLPLSLLSDLVFCERRAALHLLEGQWQENVFTVEGSILHRHTHEEEASESRGSVRIARGLRLRSLVLGLSGVTDVVEFHRAADASEGAALPGLEGSWIPYPVEYKHGRLRPQLCYEIQLCAQALCLEEMLGCGVTVGALYYGGSRRRMEIDVTVTLRDQVTAAARRLHQLVATGTTPAPEYERKCDKCSLVSTCMPKILGRPGLVAKYLAAALQ